jgi:hypothetical protein
VLEKGSGGADPLVSVGKGASIRRAIASLSRRVCGKNGLAED